jgi:hypothetical protein
MAYQPQTRKSPEKIRNNHLLDEFQLKKAKFLSMLDTLPDKVEVSFSDGIYIGQINGGETARGKGHFLVSNR